MPPPFPGSVRTTPSLRSSRPLEPLHTDPTHMCTNPFRTLCPVPSPPFRSGHDAGRTGAASRMRSAASAAKAPAAGTVVRHGGCGDCGRPSQARKAIVGGGRRRSAQCSRAERFRQGCPGDAGGAATWHRQAPRGSVGDRPSLRTGMLGNCPCRPMPVRPFQSFLAVCFAVMSPVGAVWSSRSPARRAAPTLGRRSRSHRRAGGTGRNVRFVITSRRGKDINAYSASPEEGEVLLRAGTRVRVTRKSERRDGMLHVYVEEIDDGEV